VSQEHAPCTGEECVLLPIARIDNYDETDQFYSGGERGLMLTLSALYFSCVAISALQLLFILLHSQVYIIDVVDVCLTLIFLLSPTGQVLDTERHSDLRLSRGCHSWSILRSRCDHASLLRSYPTHTVSLHNSSNQNISLFSFFSSEPRHRRVRLYSHSNSDPNDSSRVRSARLVSDLARCC